MNHKVQLGIKLAKSTEICANFWYIFTEEQLIIRLLGRLYIFAGSEEQKLKALQHNAKSDWLVATQIDVPKRFHTRLLPSGQSVPATPVNAWPVEQMMPLFEDLAQQLENELPGFCPLSLPEDPLACFTPLYLDDDGLRLKIEGVRRF